MKKIISVVLSVLVLSSSVCMSASALKPAKKEDGKKANYIEGEAIVVLKDSAGSDYTKPSKTNSVYGNGIKLKKSFAFKKKSGNFRMAVLKSSTKSTNEIISGLKKNKEIRYAFPNYKKKAYAVTDDMYSNYQWSLDNKGQNAGEAGIDIKPDALWNKAAKSEDENVVAILDTGIDDTHEDLKDMLWKNPYGNKLLGSNGIDFTGTYGDLKPRDDFGHGTHLAGVIAARANNQKGISGVNKSGVKIMSVKVLDSGGSGSSDGVIAGFEYVQRAVELGTKVTAVNCSFGGEGDESERRAYDDIFNALGEKGVITCVAAGNEELNLNNIEDPESDDYLDDDVVIPACCKSPYCVTVTSHNEKGEIPDYANVGDKYVDVAAPGTNILSTVSFNCFNPTIYNQNEIKKLCSAYQNYDGEVKNGDFGYPNIVTKIEGYSSIWKKVSVAQSDSAFGVSGKCITVKPTDKKEKKQALFVFEIPFSVENADKNYHVSFMMKSDTEASGLFLDAPADLNLDEDFDDYNYGESIAAFSSNDWSHFDYKIDVSDEEYEQSKDRKLIFLVRSESEIYIDDLALSKQSADEDDFGKYEFWSGTSMATPFVTGAVALARNAYPDASVQDIVNMVSNSGKKTDLLNGKVKNSNMLTLDNTENTPPMITKVGYNDEGKVKVEGSFKDITKAYINDKAVYILSQSADSVILPDNNYSTYNVKIKLENKNGSDETELLLSKKKEIPVSKKVLGAPIDTSTELVVPAGYKSYFIDTYYGTIGVLETVTPKSKYTYEDDVYFPDYKKVFNSENYNILSAAYNDNKIYMTVSNAIASSTNYALGFDLVLLCFDLRTEKLTKVCDLPDECLVGSTLAILKNKIYLIGGYDYKELEFLDCVYKYNPSKKQFEKNVAQLPEGRAYTEFIEYDGKLVGFYGGVKNGEMPPAIIFDGNKWNTSFLNLESDDCETYHYTETVWENVYFGNLGVDKDGVFCNGSYVYGHGDTFTYNVDSDRIIDNQYCYRNDITKPRLVGTTVPGAFIGFNVIDLDADVEIDTSSSSSDTPSATDIIPSATSDINAYSIDLNNTSRYSDQPKTPKISDEYLSLKSGEAKSIKVTDGSVKSWSSSEKSVATVKSGKVTALKIGTSTITATLKTGEKLTCFVMVTTNPSVKISGKKVSSSKTYSVKKGKSLTVKISGKASSVDNSYSSSNKKIAKVTSAKSAKSVKIKGFKKGKATVTVKVNGVRFKIKVKVKK